MEKVQKNTRPQKRVLLGKNLFREKEMEKKLGPVPQWWEFLKTVFFMFLFLHNLEIWKAFFENWVGGAFKSSGKSPEIDFPI